jgi:ribonuclease HI
MDMVARDSMRVCLGAHSVTQEGMVDPKIAEVMAALCAMQFSKEAGFFKILLEGDATQVVKEINLGPPYLSRIGHFIDSIHQEMGCFRCISFSFVPRDCNLAARVLAKETPHNKVDLSWLEDTPHSVSTIVNREQSCP